MKATDEIEGLEIHFVKEGTIISRDSRSSEKFIHGIKVLMAKNYIDNLSEETWKGMTEKAIQGISPSFAPLGYKNVDGSNGKRVIVASALRKSHTDEERFRDEAVSKLNSEHARLQGRLEAMSEDSLDGRVDLAFFDRKSRERRDEQSRILREIEGHQAANASYMEAGIRILELSRNMHRLFAKQPADEKRRLLDFVVSNCSWKGGSLTPEFRQPFDMLAVAKRSEPNIEVGNGDRKWSK